MTRCAHCRNYWAHNSGPDENFLVVTTICPTCVAAFPKWGVA
jgi:hypothetical protein